MGKIYAEEIIRKIRMAEEPQDGENENFFRFVNNTAHGYVVVKYEKMELEEKVLMDGKLSMLLPKKFGASEEEFFPEVAPEPVSPGWIYCNEEEDVTITFDFEEGEVMPDGLEGIRDEFADLMIRLYPASEIKERETIGEGTEKITRFSLIIPMPEEDCYHTKFFRAMPGGLLIGTFECSVYEKKQWGQILVQLLGTLRERDT